MSSKALPPLLRSAAQAALLTACSFLLGACGGAGKSGDGQIAVRVNKSEISVHQIQSVLQRQSVVIAEDKGDQAAVRVLEGLIDQELAAQQAREQGFDRDPRMVQALEAARRELLSTVYLDSIAQKVPMPTGDDIDHYYASHPELFSQRRLYVLQEIGTSVASGLADQLAVLVEQARSTEELAAALHKAGFRTIYLRQSAAAAEDLPQVLLQPLAGLELGRSWVLQQQGTARIFTVLHVQKAPADPQVATRVIGAYLLGERRRQAVTQAVKELRDSAKLEYLGNFAKARQAAASAPAAQSAQ